VEPRKEDNNKLEIIRDTSCISCLSHEINNMTDLLA